jgi:hypothetical protein
MEERRDTYRVWLWKPERKTPLGRPRSKLDNNTKMDLQEGAWWAWVELIWFKIGTGDGHL